MWKLSLPWWEFILRGLIVYSFLLVMLRVTGRRQIGQMSPFDLVLLLILSNAVQNAMNGGDNSVVGGLILAATLILANAALAWATARFRPLGKFVEGTPEVLIFNGKVIKETMESEGVSLEDLQGAIRVGGCEKVEQVHLATLESNGQISIVRADTEGPRRVHRTPHAIRRKGRRSGYGK